MRKIVLLLLTKTLLALPLYTTLTHAQSDNFDYSTTVGMILYVDGGGHIFQRPDYDEPRNFFIIIYGIVGKYAAQMQPQHAGLSLDISSLPVEEKFLLVNHNAQKLLFLGDHWIGDDQQFSIMETSDYYRLKQLFAETRKHRDKPTEQVALEQYSQYIHNIWENGSENFYREFYFPTTMPSPNDVSSPYSRNSGIAPDTQGEEIDIKGKLESDASELERQTTEEEHKIAIADEKTIAITSGELSGSLPQQKIQHNPTEPEKETKSYSRFWLVILLPILLLLVAYRQRNQLK